MTIIKIESQENGGHDNQTINGVTPETFPVPDGWAVIPEWLGDPDTLENYPFGEITVEEIHGVPTVTDWRALPIPEPDPRPEPPEEYSAEDMIAAFVGG